MHIHSTWQRADQPHPLCGRQICERKPKGAQLRAMTLLQYSDLNGYSGSGARDGMCVWGQSWLLKPSIFAPSYSQCLLNQWVKYQRPRECKFLSPVDLLDSVFDLSPSEIMK